MRLLTGEEAPSSGHVAYAPADLRVGYLPQSFAPDPALPLGDLLQEAVGDVTALETELVQVSMALAEAPDNTQWQQRYDEILAQLSRFDSSGGENGRLQTLLETFELDHIPPEQPCGHFERRPKDAPFPHFTAAERARYAHFG